MDGFLDISFLFWHALYITLLSTVYGAIEPQGVVRGVVAPYFEEMVGRGNLHTLHFGRGTLHALKSLFFAIGLPAKMAYGIRGALARPHS